MFETEVNTTPESVQSDFASKSTGRGDPMLQEALDLAKLGLLVFPCYGKEPAIPAKEGGKGFYDATTDPDRIKEMWSKYPRSNIGVRTGESSGLFVVDVDGDDAERALMELEVKFGALPETVTCISGGPGERRHLYFRHPGKHVFNRRGDIGPHLDSRGDGGYIIAPPSIHPDTKRRYQWKDGVLPDRGSLSDASSWLVELVTGPNAKGREWLRNQQNTPSRPVSKTPFNGSGGSDAYYKAALDGECREMAQTTEKRNDRLNIAALKLGGYVAGGHLKQDVVERALFEAAVACGYVAKDGERAARATINSGLTAGIAKGPKSAPEREPQRAKPTPTPAPDPTATADVSETEDPAASDSFTQPFDLFGDPDLTGVPVMPHGCVPDVIEAYACDEGDRIGIDPAMIAAGCIVACAAVIDDEWRVQPKRHDHTWTESARVWLANIAPPSAKKTPALNAVINPLRKIDREYAEADEALHEQYDVDTKIHAKKMDAYTAAKAKGENVPQPLPPIRPPVRRLVVNDVNIPKLGEVLADNPAGVICVQDELASWYATLTNKETGAKDRADWLSAYNGGPHVVDRIKRGTVRIPNWSVCLIGTIQPDKLRELSAKSSDDGLMQRFMLIHAQPAGRGVDRAPVPNVIENYDALISTLKGMLPATREAPIRLSEAAQAERTCLLDIIDVIGCLPDTPEPLKYHLGKWDGLFNRLCLIYHMIEAAAVGPDPYPGPEISGDTASRVLKFMRELLLPNMMKYYREMFSISPNLELARWISGYIIAHAKEKVTQRDIYRSYSSNLRDKPHLINDAMRLLDLANWVDPVESRNGRDVTEWKVNPAVHTVFAERAALEKKRRDDVKATIAKAAKLGIKTKAS